MAHDPALEAATGIVEAAIAEPSKRPTIAGFFDENTFTVSYVVPMRQPDEAAIID